MYVISHHGAILPDVIQLVVVTYKRISSIKVWSPTSVHVSSVVDAARYHSFPRIIHGCYHEATALKVNNLRIYRTKQKYDGRVEWDRAYMGRDIQACKRQKEVDKPYLPWRMNSHKQVYRIYINPTVFKFSKTHYGICHKKLTMSEFTARSKPSLRKSPMKTYRVSGIDEFPWLAELNHALLEVIERPLDQHLVLLVVIQQMIPQRLLRQHLRIANYYDTKPWEEDENILTGHMDLILNGSQILKELASHAGKKALLLRIENFPT